MALERLKIMSNFYLKWNKVHKFLVVWLILSFFFGVITSSIKDDDLRNGLDYIWLGIMIGIFILSYAFSCIRIKLEWESCSNWQNGFRIAAHLLIFLGGGIVCGFLWYLYGFSKNRFNRYLFRK